MCDSDRRQVEHRTEVKREAGAARMVSSGCVHKKGVGVLGQTPHCCLQEGTFTEREQPGFVRGARLSCDDALCANASAAQDSGAGPAGIARFTGSRLPAHEADEAASDGGIVGGRPERRSRAGQLVLLPDQLVRVRGPRAHEE